MRVVKGLKINRTAADRDPMFVAMWMAGLDTLVPIDMPAPTVEEVAPPSDMQQNDHVMRYWNWRLDRMMAKKRDGWQENPTP